MNELQKCCAAFCAVVGLALVLGFSIKVSHKVGYKDGYGAGHEAGFAEGFEAGYAAPHPADTAWRDSLVYVDKPVPVEVTPEGVELLPIGTLAQMRATIDSLLAARPDTAFVEVPVQMESKLYKGDDYEAQVSGWHPSLDWITITQHTAIVTPATPAPAPRKARLGLGAAAGPGILWTPDGWKTGAGAVVGLSLTF